MKFKVRLLLCTIAFAFAISARQLLPEVAAEIRTVLFGRGDDPVSQACSAFRDTLEEDGGLKESVFAFCSGLYEKD